MSWKSLLINEDPAPTPVPVQAHPVVPVQAIPVQIDSVPQDVPDSGIYQRLVRVTDWENTPVFQSIKKHLSPMEGMSIDPKTKFSIALKQAVALDGINPTDITQAFETAKTNLQSNLDGFKQVVTARLSTDVDAKKQKAEDLQAQARQLTQEAFEAQTKLQTSQNSFETAAQQRLSEITQKQAEYTSLLS